MAKRSQLVAGIEEHLLALFLRANRARIYGDLLREAGIRIDRALYPVLSVTAAAGPCRVSDVADAVGIDPTTASRHLASLERAGLVGRRTSGEDGRVTLVEISEAGRRAVVELRRARRGLFAALLDDFDDAELERFGDYFDRLSAAFEGLAGRESK
jgi:DNA-binding MarR family transcriptional regulator